MCIRDIRQLKRYPVVVIANSVEAIGRLLQYCDASPRCQGIEEATRNVVVDALKLRIYYEM